MNYQRDSKHKHGTTRPRNYHEAKRAARKAADKSRRANRRKGC